MIHRDVQVTDGHRPLVRHIMDCQTECTTDDQDLGMLYEIQVLEVVLIGLIYL